MHHIEYQGIHANVNQDLSGLVVFHRADGFQGKSFAVPGELLRRIVNYATPPAAPEREPLKEPSEAAIEAALESLQYSNVELMNGAAQRILFERRHRAMQAALRAAYAAELKEQGK